MYREQKHQSRWGRTVALWWTSTLLLGLVAAAQLPAARSFAQAETEAVDSQAEDTESEDTAEKSDQQAKDSEESTAANAEDEEKQADESSAEEATEEEKSSNEEAKEDDDSAVETDAPEEIEVEPPPKVEPKKEEQGSEPKQETKKKKCTIGATATLLEKQTGLKFRARVDTGAKSCSLHVEKISIENESTKTDPAERMTENIGKVITFVVKNGEGKSQPIKRKIASYVIIKNSNKKEGVRRYKVPMTFLWKNMEKEVLVTLNNRKHMEYPLLLGRNFLKGDFLVDVELNSDD